MKHIAILLLLATSVAHAETAITVSGFSYHGARDRYTFNEFNPGIGVEHDGYVAGYYKNSWSKPTVYAGYTYRPVELANGHIKAGVTAVAMTGYRYPVGVLPVVEIGSGRVSVETVYKPRMGAGTTWFVATQLRIRLGD